MERRKVLKAAVLSGAALVLGKGVAAAKEYFPVQVDEKLFQNINRVQDPAHMTVLQKLHWPVIKAPAKAKAGEIFDVDVAVGEMLHPMGPKHWIEYLQMNVGNEPGGTVEFRSHGYLKPKTRFSVLLGDELKGKKVSLVMQIKCNLHGIWESYFNVEVV